jgi:hypothetical protein
LGGGAGDSGGGTRRRGIVWGCIRHRFFEELRRVFCDLSRFEDSLDSFANDGGAFAWSDQLVDALQRFRSGDYGSLFDKRPMGITS